MPKRCDLLKKQKIYQDTQYILFTDRELGLHLI